jgi:hypothetical protein
MGRALRESTRRLPIVVALLAMMGMELDVLCNPYYPLYLLRRIPHRAPVETGANPPRGDGAWESAGGGTLADEAIPNFKVPYPRKGRPRLDIPPEMHDLVALRCKTWSPSLPHFCHGISPIPWLETTISGRDHERHRLDPDGVSRLHQLCRMRC